MAKISIEEKRWRTEADADAMARYEEIMSDTTRRNAAVKLARERAADLQKRASVMQKVAYTKAPSKKK